jgi:hypothetical protein
LFQRQRARVILVRAALRKRSATEPFGDAATTATAVAGIRKSYK